MCWPVIRECLLVAPIVMLAGCQATRKTGFCAELEAPAGLAASPSELPGGRLPVSYRVRPALSAGSNQDIQPVVHQTRPATLDCPRAESGNLAPLPKRPSEAPVCSHAFDYRWLIGCLEYNCSGGWSVRFADAGERDRYGGVLQLVGTGPMVGFHAGQMVRVEGELIDPAPLEIKPAYRVRALQAVRR